MKRSKAYSQDVKKYLHTASVYVSGTCFEIAVAFKEREEGISVRSLETRDARRKRKFRRKCDFSFEEITLRTYS